MSSTVSSSSIAPLTTALLLSALLLLLGLPVARAATITSVSQVPPTGGTVTIYGTGFRGSSEITFDGSACAVTYWDNTEVRCVVPAGIGTKTIEVTTPDYTAVTANPAVPSTTGVALSYDFNTYQCTTGGPCSTWATEFRYQEDGGAGPYLYPTTGTYPHNGCLLHGNRCLLCNGGRLDFNPGIGFTGSEFAVSAWVWIHTVDPVSFPDARIISKASGTDPGDHMFMLGFDDFDALRFRLTTSTGFKELRADIPGGEAAAGSWAHIGCSYDGANMRLFWDGEEIGSVAHTGTLVDNGEGVAICNQPAGAGDRPLPAWVEDLTIYTTAPTPAQMTGIAPTTTETATFSYSPPTVTNLIAASDVVDGGYVVTIQGAHFGATGPRSVAFGAITSACAPVSWPSQTQALCTLSTTAFLSECESSLAVTVTVGGQTSTVTEDFTFESCCDAKTINFFTQPGTVDKVSSWTIGSPEVEILLDGVRQTDPTCSYSTATVTLSLVDSTIDGTLTGRGTLTCSSGLSDTASAGLADTWTGLVVNYPNFDPGTFRLKATVGAFTTLSDSFTIHAKAATLAWSPMPATTGGGEWEDTDLLTQPGAEMLDQEANRILTGVHSDAIVTLSVASGAGNLIADSTTCVMSAGACSFTGVQLDRQDTYTLLLTSAGPVMTSSASNSVLIHGLATNIAFQSQPVGDVLPLVNLDTMPNVRVRDAYGIRIKTGPHSDLVVSLAIAPATPTGTLGSTFSIVGTSFMTAGGGIAAFTGLQINVAGTVAIRATTTAPALASVSADFTIYEAAATLVFAAQPSHSDINTAILGGQPIVHIYNAPPGSGGSRITVGPHRLLEVTVTLFAGDGSLHGDVDVAAVNGIATFSDLKVTYPNFEHGAGFVLRASTTNPAIDADSSAFTVYEAISEISIITDPIGNVLTNQLFATQPIVEILDADSDRITVGPHSTLTVVASNGGVVLGGDVRTTAFKDRVDAVNGVATFTDLEFMSNGNFEQGTSHRLEFATIVAPVITSAPSGTFTVYGRAAELVWLQQPATTDAVFEDTPLTTQPRVKIRDQHGTDVTTGPHADLDITLTKAAGIGALSATALTVTAVAGVSTFAGVRFNQMHPAYKLSASLASPIVTSADSAAFEVYGTATELLLTVNPTSDTTVFEGISVLTNPSCRFRDAFTTNIVSGQHAILPITLEKVSGPGSMTVASGATRNGGATSGHADFTGVSFDRQGDYIVRCTTPAPNLQSSDSASVKIYGSIASIEIITQPATTFATFENIALTTQPVFRILDSFNDVIADGTHSTLNVLLIKNLGPGAMSVDATTVAAVNGVATFSGLRFDKMANTYRVKARVTSPGPIDSPVSVPFEVYGTATQLIFSTQPASTTSTFEGVPLPTPPVVQMLDADGDLITTGTHSELDVTLARNIGPGGGAMTVSGPNPVTASGGVAAFSGVSFSKQGMYDLVATTATPSLSTAASTPQFEIYGGAVQLRIIQEPVANVLPYTGFTTEIQVEILDQYGDRVATGPGSMLDVTVACDGTGTLGATCTELGTTTSTASSGVANTFSVQIDMAGTFSLVASSGSLLTDTSIDFVIYEVAANLVFQTEPFHSELHTQQLATQPIVRIVNGDGDVINVGPHAFLTVTVVVGNGNGNLIGDVDVAAAGNGIATFSDLQITSPLHAGTDFRLQASVSYTLNSVLTTPTEVSADFTVHTTAVSLDFVPEPIGNSLSDDVLSTQPAVHILDENGLVIDMGDHSTLNVTLSRNGGAGTLLGTATRTAVAGVVTYDDIGIGFGGFLPSSTFTLDADLVSVAVPTLESATFTVWARATELVVITQPEGDVLSDQALSTQPIVEIRDIDGAKITVGDHAALTVTGAVATGDGTLDGTTSILASVGVATFTDVDIGYGATFTPSSTFTIEFSTSAPALDVTSSPPITIWGRADNLIFTPHPVGNRLSSQFLQTMPRVTIRDANDNIITVGAHSSLSVTLTLDNGVGELTGNLVQSASGGLTPAFTNLMVDYQTGPVDDSFVPGTDFRLRATIAAPFHIVVSNDFTVYAVATHMIFATQPVGGVISHTDLPTMPVIHFLDHDDNIVLTGPDSSRDVSLTLLGGGTGEALLGTTVDTTVSGGIPDDFVNLQVDNTMTSYYTDYALRATCAACSAPPVDSANFVIFATPTSLQVDVQPIGNVLPDTIIAQEPVVTARDAENKIVSLGPLSTLEMTISVFSGPGTFSGPTAVNAVGGSVTFSSLEIDLEHVGYVAEISMVSTGTPVETLTVTTSPFTIYQVAISLAFDTQPVGDVLPLSILATLPVVSIRDGDGDLVNEGDHSYLDITLALSGGPGGGSFLGGTLTQAASVGVASTFTDIFVNTAAIDQVEVLNFTLTATCTGLGLITETSITFKIYAVVNDLVFTLQPVGDVVSNEELGVQPVVEARDKLGNLITQGPHSTLVCILTLDDNVPQLFGALSRTGSGGIHQGFTAEVFTNTFVQPRVVATVTPTLPVPFTVTTTSVPIDVYARADHLVFFTEPFGNVPTDTPLQTAPVVHIMDKLNNLVTQGPHANLTVSLELRGSKVPPDFISVGSLVDSPYGTGIADGFTGLEVRTNGSGTDYYFRASTIDPDIDVDSVTFVIFAAATGLRFDVQPVGNVFHGDVLSQLPTIAILDSNGNAVASGDNSDAVISVSLVGGYGFETLVGTVTVTAVAGVATGFTGLYVDSPSAGSDFRLNATCDDPKLWFASNTFTVYAKATSLAWSVAPVGEVVAYENLHVLPEIVVLDDSLRVVEIGPHSNRDLYLNLTGGPPDAEWSVASDVTATAVNGVFSFTDVAITRPGLDFRIQALLDSLSLELFSANIVIYQKAVEIVYATQPFGNLENGPLLTMPEVHILDEFGQIVTTGPHSLMNVILILAGSGDPDAELRGTWENAHVTGGVATFTDLVVTLPGVGYSLAATTNLALSNETAVNTTGMYNFTVPPPPLLNVASDSFIVYGITTSVFSPTGFVELIDSGTLEYVNFLQVSTIEKMHEAVVTTDRPELFFEQPAISLLATNPTTNGTLTFATSFKRGVAKVTVVLLFGPGGSFSTPPRTFQIGVESDPGASIVSFEPTAGPSCGGYPIEVYGEFFGREERNMTRMLVGHLDCDRFEYDSDTHATCYPKFGVETGTIGVQSTSGPMGRSIAPFVVNPIPFVDAVEPTRTPSRSAVEITLTGHGLGLDQDDIESIDLGDGILCEPITWVNDSYVTCTAPAQDAVHEGQVVVTTTSGCGASDDRVERGALGNAFFEYVGPYITSVVPDAGTTEGGTLLTISGRDFGRSAGELTGLMIADINCTDVNWRNSRTIECVTGPTAGANYSGDVYVTTSTGGLGASAPGVGYTYQLALPIITNIDPVRVPLFGGYNVTISGEEFGRKQADIIGLSLAGIDCLDGMRWISSTELVCTTANVTAPRSGFVELVKWPSLATTSAPIIFEYANTTWLPAPALSRAIPGSVGTDGGDVVRLQGEFLGTNPKDILSLTIGGLPCRIISWDSPAELSCMSPPLRAGTHVVLMTTQSGGKSGDNLRIGVSYPYPEVSGFFPRIGLAAGGETVTVVGKYFGDFDEGQSVSLGGVRCTESTWISSTEMLCVIPPESAIPTGNLLTITVTNPIIGMSLASTDAYRYVPPDEICTPSCGLNADCVDGECECRAGWAITPGCLRPVVDATVVGSTAENGATAVLEVFLHAAPVLDVTVTPASADTSEGIKIAPEVPLTFTIANWNVKQPVTVQGVADRRRDGDKTYNMVLAVASDDAFFAEMAAPRIPVVNRESAPLITKITPPLSALAGSNVTIVGINFDSVLDVYVSSKAADRESIRTQTRTILVARETEAFDSSSDSGGSRARQFIDDDEPEEISEVFMVNMWSPAMKENGYYDVKVVNEGGTETTIVDGLFYTDDCPDPGQFGRGNDCADCPVGGICPGGYRLWPMEGYWTSDEEAGFVVACEPPEACIGGRYAECAEGYEGDFCGACSVGYNRRAGECQPCPGGESFLFSLIFNAILWSLVAMSAWWLHDRENLSHVIQLVLAIQEIAGIGGMVGDKVPDWMRVIYEFMTVFAGDISFLKPDCQGRVPYELQFAVRVGYAISIGLPMVCGIPIVSWFSRRWNRDKGPEVVALIKRFYQQRLTRSFSIHATLIYLTVTTTALTSIACVKRETGYVLLSDRSQRCFTPEHTIVYAASFVILLALTLGWPLSYLFWIRRNPLRMYYDENFMMRWDFLFEPFLARFRYCFLAEFWIAFVLALSNVFFQDKPLEQLIFSGGTFFGVCCGIAIMQPFRRGWENNTMLALMVSNLLAVVYIYLSKANHLTQTTERYMIWLLVFIISVVVITLLSVVLYYIFWVWTDNRTFVPPEPSVAKQWQDAQEEASASEASVSLGNLFGDLTKKDSGDNNGDAVSSAAMSLNNVDFDAVIDQLPENDPDKEEPYMDIIRAFTSLEDYDLPGDEAREAEEPVGDDDQEPTFFETAVDLFESWQMLSTLSGFEHIVAPSESSTEESESAIPSVPKEGAAEESEYEYYTSGSETRERRRTNDVVDPAAELAKQMSGKLAQKIYLERKKREKENARRAKKGLPLLNEHGREEEGESEWSYYSEEESLPPMPPLQDIEPGFFG